MLILGTGIEIFKRLEITKAHICAPNIRFHEYLL